MQAILYSNLFLLRSEGDHSMASVPERLATVETTLSHIKGILLVFVPLAIAWGSYITVNVVSMRQAMADGGNAKLVAELKAPKSTQQLQANLITVTAQIQAARVDGKKPNPQKLRALSGALTQVVQKNPDLAEGWRAVAVLASYRTSDVLENASALPDCDISQKAHAIPASDIPETPYTAGSFGFVFRNCRLYLDHLPPGKLIKTTLAAPFGNAPAGNSVYGGDHAFIINCEIVLTDSGIAESPILIFHAINCRFEYQIENKPPSSSQEFLLASLDAPNPGQFSFSLATKNGA
jgi:hypothetical protein